MIYYTDFLHFDPKISKRIDNKKVRTTNVNIKRRESLIIEKLTDSTYIINSALITVFLHLFRGLVEVMLKNLIIMRALVNYISYIFRLNIKKNVPPPPLTQSVLYCH